MPARWRRDEAFDRATTPFPPIILDATPLNLPAIFVSEFSLLIPNQSVVLIKNSKRRRKTAHYTVQ